MGHPLLWLDGGTGQGLTLSDTLDVDISKPRILRITAFEITEVSSGGESFVLDVDSLDSGKVV